MWEGPGPRWRQGAGPNHPHTGMVRTICLSKRREYLQRPPVATATKAYRKKSKNLLQPHGPSYSPIGAGDLVLSNPPKGRRSPKAPSAVGGVWGWKKGKGENTVPVGCITVLAGQIKYEALPSQLAPFDPGTVAPKKGTLLRRSSFRWVGPASYMIFYETCNAQGTSMEQRDR